MTTETNSRAIAPAPQNNQVATRTPIEKMLDAHKDQIAAALPKHMDADRMARMYLTEFRKVPKLLDCDPKSLFGAVIQCSQLGLEPGGALGHVYLIPFKKEVQVIIGFKGLMELVRRSGRVVNISAQVVRENDVFEYEQGTSPKIRHLPQIKGGGEIIAAYAVAHFKDGTKQFEVMSLEEVIAIRDGSQGYQAAKRFNSSSPWDTHFDQMAKKTAIRRLCKYMPLSPELQRALELDDKADAGESQAFANAIDAEFETIPDGHGGQINPNTGEVQSGMPADEDGAVEGQQTLQY